ncbi:uncharacterized protein LOC141643870 [Silene latifolia]|uniref:uncharacterized protein LOC141643870 n=1 Tax=Silene latifolia TaxID=37657 RepID=UPI003D776CE1
MRWQHHDHKSNSSKKHGGGDKFHDIGKSPKNSNNEDGYEDKYEGSTKSYRHKYSVDDSFFKRSSSLLSRSTSKRSQTPNPTLRRSSSRSGSMISSLKRSFSRRAASTSSSTEISNVTLSKLMSQNNDNSTPRANSGLSRSTSRRSTTPIIFSQSTARKKPQPIEKKLECSLEELCFGAVKKMNITRDVISDEGIIIQEEDTLQINVKPGWKKGTTIIFEGKGDEKPGHLPADIIFTIDEKRHPMFKRVGDNLELGVEVPLVKALIGCTILVPLLGGEEMSITIDEVIYPGFEKVIKEQGMPKSKELGLRGDLVLKFLVSFPSELSVDKRRTICNILQDCCYEV